LITVNNRCDGPVDQDPIFSEAHRDNGFYIEDVDKVVIPAVVERGIVLEGHANKSAYRILGNLVWHHRIVLQQSKRPSSKPGTRHRELQCVGIQLYHQ